MKNELNNQVGMLGDMFLQLVANLKQGVFYFIKQACGNDILALVQILQGTLNILFRVQIKRGIISHFIEFIVRARVNSQYGCGKDFQVINMDRPLSFL